MFDNMLSVFENNC